MTAPTTVRSATRRFVVLTALRWLPVGLTVPVMVLLAAARGLSLPDIGLLFTVYGLVVISLELPTGGLADVIGRRAVIVVGAALHVLSCLTFAVAEDVPAFLLAMVLHGVGRALESGPLEAWYVDTVHELDRDADVAPGLAAHSAADGGGLAVGAVAGGFLPVLLGGGASALAVPFLVAAALDLLYVGAVLRLLTETRPPRVGSALASLVTGTREVPATVRAAVRLSFTDPPLRLVLLLTAAGGAGIVAFELLAPARFSDLAGGPDKGAAVLGTVQALSFGAAALGALGGPWLRRRLGGSTPVTCAVLAVLGAAGVAGFGATTAVLVAGLAFGSYYVAHGATWPLLSAVMHSRVSAAQRATAVSAMSLAMSLGGMAGNLVLPRVSAAISLPVAFLAMGGVLLLSALLCLRLPAAAPTRERVTAS